MLKRNEITLDDKYEATDGTVFISGTQALVRLPLTQIRRDLAAGLNTGGFISGYRGRPSAATTWNSTVRPSACDNIMSSSCRR